MKLSGKDYRDLLAWQRAMDLVELVYRATACFPTEERYGLMSQMRRAAVSIPSNIAEGQSRKSSRDFAHFLTIAQGSRAELETQTLVAERMDLFKTDRSTPILEAAAEVGRLIHGLVNSLDRV
jgi:four helix bundle protein